MNVILGAVLAVAAGVVNGLFAIPMKLAKQWSWENIWLPYSIWAFAVLPFMAALLGTPRLMDAYRQAGPSSLTIAVLCGIAVYVGSLMFGIALGLIGSALAFALLVGSMSAIGVLGPILAFQPAALATTGGKWIVFGISGLFVAVAICARAGALKARAQAGSSLQQRGRSSTFRGMLLAIVGGIISGFLPLGMSMAWARGIAQAAVRFGGASEVAAQNAVLFPILIGGALPNCLYSTCLLLKNKTYKSYRGSGWYWLITLLMALMYWGGVAMWGISSSANMLGRLGPSVGWALVVGGMVVSSNLGGFATGEWKNTGLRPLEWMAGGVSLMIVAVVLIGYGNFLLNS